MTYEDSHVIMRIKLAPEIGKWRVTQPKTGGTFEAEFSLRGDGALLRRIRNDNGFWQPYEQFTAAGWTIDTTIEFLHSQYKNVTLA